jgi:hypothetical protein
MADFRTHPAIREFGARHRWWGARLAGGGPRTLSSQSGRGSATGILLRRRHCRSRRACHTGVPRGHSRAGAAASGAIRVGPRGGGRWRIPLGGGLPVEISRRGRQIIRTPRGSSRGVFVLRSPAQTTPEAIGSTRRTGWQYRSPNVRSCASSCSLRSSYRSAI